MTWQAALWVAGMFMVLLWNLHVLQERVAQLQRDVAALKEKA